MKERRNLIVKESRNGKGIFTRKFFSSRETIFEVTGVLVSGDEGDEMDETARSNTYRYDADWYISPKGSIGDFLNHSCNPNAKVIKLKKKLYIQAINSIQKNSEVVIDYSTITAKDDSWRMKCKCGSAKCRFLISRFAALPKVTREKYITQNIVPAYILEI